MVPGYLLLLSEASHENANPVFDLGVLPVCVSTNPKDPVALW